jgi:hypothetical protein
VTEEVEEADLVGLCFGFDFGSGARDLAGTFESLSDGTNKPLEKCKGESELSLCTKEEVAVSISN